MYYDTQRKLAFVMPPRTGTTMFSTLLTQWNLLNAGNDRHAMPHQVQIDNFSEYTIYGFFRNPLDRFLSLLRYMQKKYNNFYKLTDDIGLPPDKIRLLNYDELIDLFPKYKNTFSFSFFDAQEKWLKNAKILNYCNYVPEILRVARMLDVTQVHVGVMNETDNAGIAPSQKVIDFVQAQYADDYRLGRERGLLA